MSNGHNLHDHSFLGFLPGVLARQAKSQIKELFVSSAILDLAVAMILFFEPIYLYNQGLSLRGIMLFYLGVYLVYFFIMPLGGKFIKRHGFEHSILLGSFLLILYYLNLALVAKSFYFLIPAAVFYALQKTFYWPGYHADFARYGQDGEQGREVSNITVIISLVFILGPLIGGAVMYFFGFTVLFIMVSLLIILSNIPLILTPERFEPSSFSYKGAYSRLFKSENRRRFFAYLGFGEELIALALWPIFMFAVLRNTLSTGAVIALATLITAIVVLYIGKLADQRNKRSLLRFTTIIYSIGWFIRILSRAPLGIFLLDTFSRIGKNSLSVPLTAITYNHARERGVVKNVVFFEMALVVGKVLSIIAVLLILTLVPLNLQWPAIFVLAGLFSLLYSLL
ncbi:MAG: MFS transporter [Candidatus Jacksonbacteria bacterium]